VSAAIPPPADATCDGGDLDCGSGLLLIIREAMAPLAPGGVLEVRSREASVRVDLPAWCRLVGHALEQEREGSGGSRSFFLRKNPAAAENPLAQDLRRAQDFSWSVRVRAREPMRAEVFARNHSFTIGQPASFDTRDPAPSAIEHLLGALAADLAVGLRWRASRRGVEIRELEVNLKASSRNILVYLGMEETGDPGLAAISGRMFVDTDADEALLTEIWQDTLARSPIAATLLRGAALPIELRRA
jgi:TusA-related sulfurtransferase